MILPKFTVDDIIKNALKEDINYIDVATDLTLSDQNIQKGVFLAKASGKVKEIIPFFFRPFTLFSVYGRQIGI